MGKIGERKIGNMVSCYRGRDQPPLLPLVTAKTNCYHSRLCVLQVYLLLKPWNRALQFWSCPMGWNPAQSGDFPVLSQLVQLTSLPGLELENTVRGLHVSFFHAYVVNKTFLVHYLHPPHSPKLCNTHTHAHTNTHTQPYCKPLMHLGILIIFACVCMCVFLIMFENQVKAHNQIFKYIILNVLLYN